MDVKGKLVELLANHCDMKDKRCVGCEKGLQETAECKDGRFGKVADRLIAHGVTVQEWIPVSEGLPELNTDVLVCDARYGHFGVWSLAKDKDEDTLYWEDDGGWFKSLDDVTHWMALPEPPKEG